MINATELRLFNKVSCKGDDDNNIVAIELDEDGYSVVLSDYRGGVTGWVDVKEIDPIPLTPEWLERMGFAEGFREKMGKCWTIDIMPSAKRVLGVCHMMPRTLVSFVSEPGNIVMLQTIHDVHQLQNLYFALTGKELEIRELV